MKKIEFDFLNLEFKNDVTVIKNKIKEYINSDDCNKLYFNFSDESKSKIDKYDTFAKIISFLIFVFFAVGGVAIISSKYFDVFSSPGYEYITMFCIILIVFVVAAAGYELLSFMYDMIKSAFIFDSFFQKDKVYMLEDLENMDFMDFINKWYDGIHCNNYTAYTNENTIHSAIQSYIVQEKIKEINNEFPILKIRSCGSKRAFKVYYAISDGTVVNEEFNYHKIIQNVNIDKPHIKFDENGIFIVLPVKSEK